MEHFLAAFSAGKTVGEAIRLMRWSLLGLGNLLGFCYSPYCAAGLRLRLAMYSIGLVVGMGLYLAASLAGRSVRLPAQRSGGWAASVCGPLAGPCGGVLDRRSARAVGLSSTASQEYRTD